MVKSLVTVSVAAYATGSPGLESPPLLYGERQFVLTNGHGTIVVRTWHDADRETVVLEINDDGPGIPDDLQPKIFDPFFTTKEVGRGTGQGLAIARSIVVDKHGGRIDVTSTPGAGTRFSVLLPIQGRKPQEGV